MKVRIINSSKKINHDSLYKIFCDVIRKDLEKKDIEKNEYEGEENEKNSSASKS